VPPAALVGLRAGSRWSAGRVRLDVGVGRYLAGTAADGCAAGDLRPESPEPSKELVQDEAPVPLLVVPGALGLADDAGELVGDLL
jgi:hypothetical protein